MYLNNQTYLSNQTIQSNLIFHCNLIYQRTQKKNYIHYLQNNRTYLSSPNNLAFQNSQNSQNFQDYPHCNLIFLSILSIQMPSKLQLAHYSQMYQNTLMILNIPHLLLPVG